MLSPGIVCRRAGAESWFVSFGPFRVADDVAMWPLDRVQLLPGQGSMWVSTLKNANGFNEIIWGMCASFDDSECLPFRWVGPLHTLDLVRNWCVVMLVCRRATLSLEHVARMAFLNLNKNMLLKLGRDINVLLVFDVSLLGTLVGLVLCVALGVPDIDLCSMLVGRGACAGSSGRVWNSYFRTFSGFGRMPHNSP